MYNGFFKDLEHDIKENNPYTMFNKYHEIFKNNIEDLPSRKIEVGKEYFRARAGMKNEKGAIDDCDIEIHIPYFRDEIGAAPILHTPGGRFNREGNSFLYLASDINTCVSEMKLEKGQTCSIGKFKCIKEGKYFDLVCENSSDFFGEVKKIMLQPIHKEIRYKYLITQFISDIIRNIGFSGIIYGSTQSEGENLVCFEKEAYEFVDYSEEMYEIREIKYTVSKVEEGYKKYSMYDRELSSFNKREEEKKRAIFDYIQKKIYVEQKKAIKRKIELAKNSSPDKKNNIYDELVEEFKSSIYSKDVFNARGDFFRDINKYESAILDYYYARTYKGFVNISMEDLLSEITSKINKPNITKEFIKEIIDAYKNKSKKKLEECLEYLKNMNK